jgi:TonB-dependent SusC/RagA subfamily outer membrane receptor
VLKTTFPPRVLTAVVLVPLAVSLACAKRPNTNEPRPAGPDTASIANGDGKSIDNLFAGRFPGVTVASAPNGGLSIRINGTSSFYGGEEPLYVLDDTPLPPNTGGVVFVNPYDIQRIEVLKNPADLAVYGVRGANGVVRITTKRPSQRRTSSSPER